MKTGIPILTAKNTDTATKPTSKKLKAAILPIDPTIENFFIYVIC